MKTSDLGIALIKSFEGLRLKAYKDIVGVPTIGYGSTHGVTMGDEITEAEAEAMLLEDLKEYEDCVNQCVTVEITQTEFDALVSFAYNLGCGALRSSTLLKLLNAGNKEAAAQQFRRWNKAGGVEVAGLTRRRLAEADLFMEA